MIEMRTQKVMKVELESYGLNSKLGQRSSQRDEKGRKRDDGEERNQDTVRISYEAAELAVKEQLARQRQEMVDDFRLLQMKLEQAREAGDGMFDAIRERVLLLRIASRIMGGDNVPLEDHRFLSERDPALYMKAISLRIDNDDPYDHDRLSDEEEHQGVPVAEDTLSRGGLDGSAGAADLPQGGATQYISTLNQ